MTYRELPAVPDSSGASYACFVQDVGGWWTQAGIHHDKELLLKLITKFKCGKNVRAVLAIEIPSCHKSYDWER